VYADDARRVWQGGGTLVRPLHHLRNPWGGRSVDALPEEPLPVDFVSGCALLIRARLLEELGHLDTRYIYSVEDLDLCTRARAAGHTVLFVPGCVVTHQHGASVGGWHSALAIRHAMWGRAHYAAKFGNAFTRWCAWLFLACIVLPFKAARRTGKESRLRVLRDGLRCLRRGARGEPLPAPRWPGDPRT
jgi:GT2 family glycosyltransferase